LPVDEFVRKYDTSTVSFYTWKQKYDGSKASEVQWLRNLELACRRIQVLRGLLASFAWAMKPARVARVNEAGDSRLKWS
jgi:hypothetical protein